MNFLQMGFISLESVAVNIITCFWCGVARKMFCTSARMSIAVVGGGRRSSSSGILGRRGRAGVCAGVCVNMQQC